jgi:hypothetical protein
MTDLGLTPDSTATCPACGAQNERAQARCWSCGNRMGDAGDAELQRGDLELEEVVRAMGAEGYDGHFDVVGGAIRCEVCGASFGPTGAPVRERRQARDTPTGRSDVTVLAIACPTCATLGVVTDTEALEPDGTAGGQPAEGTAAARTPRERRDRPASAERPLGEDRQHMVTVDDGDTRSLRERGSLVDEDGDDIREYTGEPVDTEEGTVIPQQQNVGAGNEAGGGEWPDPRTPPAQPGA